MVKAMENLIPKEQIEQYVMQIVQAQWQQKVVKEQLEPLMLTLMQGRFSEMMEEYVKAGELRAKEMAIMERVVRIEDELKSMRQMSEQNFDLMKQRFQESDKRFEATEKRLELLQQEMSTRFEVVEKRFDVMDQRFDLVDKRFEALQREMSARFEASQREMSARFDVVDKKFTFFQWILGIVLGIPALIFTFTQLFLAFK